MKAAYFRFVSMCFWILAYIMVTVAWICIAAVKALWDVAGYIIAILIWYIYHLIVVSQC